MDQLGIEPALAWDAGVADGIFNQLHHNTSSSTNVHRHIAPLVSLLVSKSSLLTVSSMPPTGVSYQSDHSSCGPCKGNTLCLGSGTCQLPHFGQQPQFPTLSVEEEKYQVTELCYFNDVRSEQCLAQRYTKIRRLQHQAPKMLALPEYRTSGERA